MTRIVVVGGGIGGLASAALLARAGHEVTLLEATQHLGGKSRRISVGGQRIDTGPSLVTFPDVWNELLRRWDALGGTQGEAGIVADVRLRRLPEVGRYYYRDEVCSLPVPKQHRWYGAWERFAKIHGGLGPEITRLLTADPLDSRTLPALSGLLRIYGVRLTTRSYLDSLGWLPEGLREIIAIHTLNAGVSPERTPALYASMPAIMASEGVWVPDGGIYELVLGLEKLARRAGVEIQTGEPVARIERGRVLTDGAGYRADVVVGGIDNDRLERLAGPHAEPRPKRLSCSGVAIYAALRERLPPEIPTHGVVLPSNPEDLYHSLEAGREPSETMAFVNLYRPGETHPNEKETLALLLTAPANGEKYDLEDELVVREVARVSRLLGLDRPLTDYFGDSQILHPQYFGQWGSEGGALYGPVHPFWRSGPLHRPRYSEGGRPWLWRVGASVHPGGGIPAVLGGAMISTSRLLKRLRAGKA